MHITNQLTDLTNVVSYNKEVITGAGPVHSQSKVTPLIYGLQLENVLVILRYPRKLISIGTLTGEGGELHLSSGNDRLISQGKRFGLTKVGKLYRLEKQELFLAFRL